MGLDRSNVGQIDDSISSPSTLWSSEKIMNVINGELISISDNGQGVVNLTTDRYQYIENIVDGTEIVLPSVAEDNAEMVQIDLFFHTATDLTLVLPNVQWQKEPIIVGGKTYELMFSRVGTTWIAGCVMYG